MPLLTRAAVPALAALLLAASAASAQQKADGDEPPNLEGYWYFKAVPAGNTCPGLFGKEFHGDGFEAPVELQQRARTIRMRLENEQAEGRIKGDTITFVSTNTAAMEACEVQSRSVMVLKLEGGTLSGTQREYSLCDVMMPGVKCPFDQCTSDATITLTRLASKDAFNAEISKHKTRMSKAASSQPKVTREAAQKALGEYCR